MASKRFGAIDVGTNSVLLLVGELEPAGPLAIRFDRSLITRLGQDLRASGVLAPEAMERTAAALAELVTQAHGLGVAPERLVAAGTMGLRTAGNAVGFIERVRRETGLRIQVVSGEEEARLTFLGVRSGLPDEAERLTVFDVGGGSTEFIFARGERIWRRFSLDVGAVRLTEDFCTSDPVTAEQLSRLLQYLASEAFIDLRAEADFERLVGVGGTLTTLAALRLGLVPYDPERIQGQVLAAADIEALVQQLRGATLTERAAMRGMEPKRADVILAGAAIVQVVLRKLGATAVAVSDRGLRHGLLLDRFGRPRGSAVLR